MGLAASFGHHVWTPLWCLGTHGCHQQLSLGTLWGISKGVTRVIDWHTRIPHKVIVGILVLLSWWHLVTWLWAARGQAKNNWIPLAVQNSGTPYNPLPVVSQNGHWFNNEHTSKLGGLPHLDKIPTGSCAACPLWHQQSFARCSHQLQHQVANAGVIR